MTLLLDTHTVLWMSEDLPSLGKAARKACVDALIADSIAVPSIVFYEVGSLLRRCRVAGPPSVKEWRSRLVARGLKEVPLTAEIAMAASELEAMHGDPIDRIIVATAQIEDAVLLTADRAILDWKGKVRRQDARR